MPTSNKKDPTIVIGAGLAGLYSAALLQNLGREVLILEARDRVGGRTFSDGGVDLGGQWVSSKHPRVMKLCEQFGLTLYRQFDEGIHIACLNQNREEYGGTFSDAGLRDAVETRLELIQHYAQSFDQLANSLDFMNEHKALDQINFAGWCEENIADLNVRSLIHFAFYANTCIPPSHASLFFWLYFLKVCGGYHNIMSIREGAQEFRIDGGAQTLSLHLARGLNILYESPVIRIQKQKGIFYCHTGDQKVYRASQVVCAIPMQLIPKIEWVPGLEPERLTLCQAMKMGSVTKMVIQYETAFWRDKGYSGAIISDIPPVSLCYDACNEKYKALVVFLIGGQTPSDEAVLEHLASLLKDDSAKTPSKIDRKNWNEDPFSGGCYFCVPPINTLAARYHYFTAPEDGIYFVGTETARHWMGYMEGALESAERLVTQIG